jgi:hypothetical protein
MPLAHQQPLTRHICCCKPLYTILQLNISPPVPCLDGDSLAAEPGAADVFTLSLAATRMRTGSSYTLSDRLLLRRCQSACNRRNSKYVVPLYVRGVGINCLWKT